MSSPSQRPHDSTSALETLLAPSRPRSLASPSPARSTSTRASYGTMDPHTQPEMSSVAGGSGASVSVPASPTRPPPAPPRSTAASSPFSTAARSTSPPRQRNGKQPATLQEDGDANGSASGGGQKKGGKGKRRWFPRLAFELENKGSVARDHLASERTFLAWLRTSLALASIGIAITQLFRLPSNTTTNSSGTSAAASSAAASATSDLSSQFASVASAYPSLAPLLPLLQAQEARLAAAEVTVKDSTRYKHLGKPIGGTFIILALVVLVLGIHRYFVTQAALMKDPSHFPPSRRSVGFASFTVGALIIATFVAILTVR
ncbi:hypothetical protein JCM8097_008540 [Rhodosporidiobolus ruineniae]